MGKPELIKATKNGKWAVFSQKAWASGQPQRYGWHSESDELPLKKLPTEILEFAEIRKKVIPSEPIVITPEIKPDKPQPKDEPPIPVAEAAPKAKPKAKRKPTTKKGAKK